MGLRQGAGSGAAVFHWGRYLGSAAGLSFVHSHQQGSNFKFKFWRNVGTLCVCVLFFF